MSRLFGTDGIRGVANMEPLTTELAFRLGRQLVATLLDHHGVKKVRLVVGRDTRLSGPMLEAALVSGALSAGGDVYTVGVLPTPAIAFLTRRLEAHGGIVLSASHNPFADNGIKIFSSEGAKFPDAWEDEIEARLAGPDKAPKPTGAEIGSILRYKGADTDYVSDARRACLFDLGGMTIVLDCAHGATYRVAPKVFRSLGARVIVLGARPDGLNINLQVGALHPDVLRTRVLSAGAHLGHRLRRRRRSADLGRRARRDPGWRLRARHLRPPYGEQGPAHGERGRDHRDGESRARQGAPGRGSPDGQDPGRGPLRARGDAEGRRQPRRRAIGPLALPRSLDHGGRDRVRAAPARRHAGDRATALRAGGVHGQVPAGARQRAGQGATPVRRHSRPCRPGERLRGRGERGGADPAPLFGHGVARARHARGEEQGHIERVAGRSQP